MPFLIMFFLLLTGGLYAQATDPAQLDALVQQGGKIAVDQRTIDYHNGSNWIWAVFQLLSIAIPLWFFFSTAARRLRDWIAERVKHPTLVLLVFASIFLIIQYLLFLPLSFYAGYLRQHAYGLSNQNLGRWAYHSFLGLTIDIGAVWLFLAIPYYAMRRWPARWWLYIGLGQLPISFVMAIVFPIWISPLFNNYTLLPPGPTREVVEQVASQAGFPKIDVFQVDKSSDTDAINAYVTGFLGTRRIVLWDTLIKQLNPPEIRFVVAHEMGHYVHNDVYIFVLINSLVTLAIFHILYKWSAYFRLRLPDKYGLTAIHDPVSFPLYLAIFIILTNFADPALNSMSRSREKRADLYALQLTGESAGGNGAPSKGEKSNPIHPAPGTFF